MNLRVAVLHNAVSADAGAAERDVLAQVDAVTAALLALGHEPIPLPCTLDLDAVREELLESRPDLVFNLVESLCGHDSLQHVVPALLDAIGLPFTGSGTLALLVTNDKPRAKEWMRGWGVRTPDWLGIGGAGAGEAAAGALEFPARYIVKPASEHASPGVGDDSVVDCRDRDDLERAIARFRDRLGRPSFAERFVSGREFNVACLERPGGGADVLPPAEIEFRDFPDGKPRIVGYRAKWVEESFEYRNTPRRFDFPKDDAPLLAELGRLALTAWRGFDLGGYARVDFRVDDDGRPWALEVNANPCLSDHAGFVAALARAEIEFPRAVERMLACALRRRRRDPR